MTPEHHAEKAFDAYCKAVSIKGTKDWEYKDLPPASKKAWLGVGKYIAGEVSKKECEIKKLKGDLKYTRYKKSFR